MVFTPIHEDPYRDKVQNGEDAEKKRLKKEGNELRSLNQRVSTIDEPKDVPLLAVAERSLPHS